MSDEMLRTPAAPGIDLLNTAYFQGWACASSWAGRADLVSDVGSGAYTRERDARLRPLIDASPKGGSDAAAWQSPDDLPDVATGDMGWFWVAVRRANGMTYNFPASYLNAMLLSDEDGGHDEPKAGNRYSYGAADEDDGSFPATGWHEAKEHSEYDSIYMPLLADGDGLIAWRAVEDFTLQATSAEVKP